MLKKVYLKTWLKTWLLVLIYNKRFIVKPHTSDIRMTYDIRMT